MNLFEYIKSQLPHLPNPAIMKNLGASEELIGYVRETVWNTNLNIIEVFNSDSDDNVEIWANGSPGSEGYIYPDNHIEQDNFPDIPCIFTFLKTTYAEWKDLFDNPSNYLINVTDGKNICPLIFYEAEHKWSDADDVQRIELRDNNAIYVAVNQINDYITNNINIQIINKQ